MITKLCRYSSYALILLGLIISPFDASADPVSAEHAKSGIPKNIALEQTLANRRQLFEQFQALTHIPWYTLAAIDQYERTLNTIKPKQRPRTPGLTAIYIPAKVWTGPLNPDPED